LINYNFPWTGVLEKKSTLKMMEKQKKRGEVVPMLNKSCTRQWRFIVPKQKPALVCTKRQVT
jgi:hypothetical protein